MMAFDFAPLIAAGSPPPAVKWKPPGKYNFTFGNNDPDGLAVEDLKASLQAAVSREGRRLSDYRLHMGPQGYKPLREFLVKKLKRDAAIECEADDIVLTSGSLQGLDLINGALLAAGDTVICEEDCYEGTINRYGKRGVNVVAIPLDKGGMRMDALEKALAELKSRGVRPKYIYTIPTVQNPTATVLDEGRRKKLLELAERYDVPIFEDDCYADLTWSGERPPAIYAMSKSQNVIHIGSFSKTIAPALRVGFIVAPWAILSHILALKTDAGSGGLEQMMLADYCERHFAEHVPQLRKRFKAKLDTLVAALNEQFGTAAEFDYPPGGIFLWVKLPDTVDAMKLRDKALASGVVINPGPEWSVNKLHSRSRIRLCFASPTHEEIKEGIAVLADVCRKEFGVPARSANVERRVGA
ncbi:MAG TPA: PLP-dependent aminotransferase family protein [Pseudolabrys sp.]|jgi:2-aminoadipate transaminase|nr:PLP-dependent aminotransferase family protein [Pseudolabrys sp.]